MKIQFETAEQRWGYYQAQAEEAEQKASQTTDEEVRATWLHLAQSWRAIADQVDIHQTAAT